MQNQTTEFSFVLKPSVHGVGVFAVHDIGKDSYLRLFGNADKDYRVSIMRDKKDVPNNFKLYCIDRGEKLSCPRDFGRMEIGWYLNHSESPNAFHRNYNYYALRDIKAEEEILIDYNTFGEPEDAKADFYRKG